MRYNTKFLVIYLKTKFWQPFKSGTFQCKIDTKKAMMLQKAINGENYHTDI